MPISPHPPHTHCTNVADEQIPNAQVGEQRNRNRWLTIGPNSLPPCTTTRLRATIPQPVSSDNEFISVSLTPRRAGLVALLDTDSQHVGYTDSVFLRAGSSYDPDLVQVLGRLFIMVFWG